MTWLFFQAVVSGLLLGGVYGLVASGLSLIFGVLRIINFAHGAVMMLGMYASYWLFVLLGVDPYLSILITGPLFFGIGVLIQRIVIEPNRAAAEHNQLLLTLGLALFLENLALVLWQGDFRTVRVCLLGGVLRGGRRAGRGAAADRGGRRGAHRAARSGPSCA